MGVTSNLPRVGASLALRKAGLQRVFDNLRASGFQLVGPTVREGAVVLDEIARLEDLPVGWTDEAAPGRYRLKRTGNGDYFACALGPQSWKKFLYPSRLPLFSTAKENGKWKFKPAEDAPPRYALVGVRPCDLSAITVQDRVFLGGEFRDPHYAQRRGQLFALVVNCGHATSSCFCPSMKTGPKATAGFDVALTELPDIFVAEVGSEAGSEMMRGAPWEPATAFDLGRAAQVLQRAESEITRRFRTDDLPKVLFDNLEHPRWDQVAARCLSCANCTQVCPTCFCSTVEDTSNLKATAAERTRVWDSCFVLDFSHVFGGNIRPSTRSRYRQWLTHKLASWIGQFGVSGCVGCGRCITWCPVGIDLTEEVQAIREKGSK